MHPTQHSHFHNLNQETSNHLSMATTTTTFVSCVIVAAFLPVLLYLYHEYLAFKDLGRGGTPQTLTGFLKVFLLSFVTLSNPYELPPPRQPTDQEAGFLRDLPRRRDPRPQTRGIAPHRQTTQQGNSQTYTLLTSSLANLAHTHPTLLRTGTSCFEHHSTGLFARQPVRATCAGEIVHTHPSDGGSMHLTLCEADVRVVLERGWGERHPLARGGWFERFVPEGFVMVYAPRDEGGVEVALQVVRAAAGWVCGVELGEVEDGSTT